MPAPPVSAPFNRLPLIGRTEELNELTSAIDSAARGHGRTIILAGEGGVGKTRLLEAAVEHAAATGWTVALGRAYPVESGVPYALFSDALVPMLRKMDSGALQTLTRGGTAELTYMFPALATGSSGGSAVRGETGELKSRLLWNFAQFIARLAAKSPVLLALENLQWADASSIEVLHFLARQISKERVMLLCSYNDAERDQNPALGKLEQSLLSLGAATVRRLAPLSIADTGSLVRRVFNVEQTVAAEFSALLYGWTRGNPFFVEETLKTLVESGRLYSRDGSWLGWELEALELPRTVRDAVTLRLGRLSPPARTVADLAAVVGALVTHDALRAVAALDEDTMLTAVDELNRERVLVEIGGDAGVAYDFSHPIVRDTLYGELGRARARALHATVAESLERYYGTSAGQHVDELAFHFARADAERLAGKAIRYLAAAGRDALRKHANREAASYLGAALQQADRLTAAGSGDLPEAVGLVEDLARSRQRLGEYEAARALWERALNDAQTAGDRSREGSLERRLGLAAYWSGKHEDALSRFDRAERAADAANDEGLAARVRLARGMTLQEVGRPIEAQAEVEEALEIAQRAGDDALLARAHRALTLLYLFSGPPERAREHGAQAIALAARAGERGVEWSARWASAILEGFTGHIEAFRDHLAHAERLAEELRSPVLRVWTAEVGIEYATASGDWETARALGERTIAVARALGQRTLLPRLLVWSALVYVGRGEWERAKSYIDEAWELSGAERTGGAIDVHMVVPAHMGRAAYHLARREYEEAIRFGEAGLAVADRTGYVAWAIHRLLPIIGEAALWTQDWERAERHGARVKRDAQRLGHQLGLAWSEASDAVLIFLREKDPERAIPMLRAAAERLEALPFVEYAARMRRTMARAMSAHGDRDGAMRELRSVHETLAKLGAEPELVITRHDMRELGARPPSRTMAAGADGLTGREIEIARLVADRKSNKEIGTALQISPRTVSTHLSNIFQKLSVDSRGELTDLVRSGGIGSDKA